MAQVNGFGERVECAALAGSVIVFEANGFHRWNRSLGPRRDTIFGNYAASRHRIGCQFNPATFPHLSESAEKYSPAEPHAVERISLKLRQRLRPAAAIILISI